MITFMLFELKNPIPIYLEINFDQEEFPFGLKKAKRTNCFDNLRCERIEFVPHVHTTHLETSDHINRNSEVGCLPLSLSGPLYTQIIDDTAEFEIKEDVEFVILKKSSPKMKDFRGVDVVTIENILKMPSVKVIGINEPSFDPEFNDGKLLAHRTAFKRDEIYLVEMLNLPLEIEENEFYYCLLNIFRLAKMTDAYPCSPILYPMKYTEMAALCDSCLFCKIIRGVIPSFKVYENNLTFAFLDINPLSEAHILVIPKFHGVRLHEITDEHLADILPVARKILIKGFGEDGASVIPSYNILQNNGRLAHQEVDHVHFHIIPKRNEEEGLGIKWPSSQGNMSILAKYAESLRTKISDE